MLIQTIGFGRTSAAASSLLTGIVSWHSLEEASGTRLDSHGSNDLTDNNTVTQVVGGGPGGQDCAEFTAANSETLSISDAAQTGLHPDNANWTESIWAWVNSFDNNMGIASRNNNTGDQREFLLESDDLGTPLIGRSSDGTATNFAETSAGSAISTGTWVHFIWWHDADNNEVGIVLDDGTPVTGAQDASGIFESSAAFRLGGRDDGIQYLDGRLWGHGVWSRLLTSQERTELYNSGSGLAYPF